MKLLIVLLALLVSGCYTYQIDDYTKELREDCAYVQEKLTRLSRGQQYEVLVTQNDGHTYTLTESTDCSKLEKVKND